MTYLRRSNLSEKRSRTTVFVVAVCLVLGFALYYFFPGFYPRVLYPVTSVFWRAESSTVGWFVNMGKLVESKYSLVKDNKRLRDEMASRDVSALLVDSLRAENSELKESLGRSSKSNDILASILSRPPVSAYDTLIVDAGSNDGVHAGDKVYVHGDALIGDVAEVYPREAKVSLFSTPGRVTPVLVGTSSIAAQATGKGGGNFTLTLPVESGIKTGDTVVLPQMRTHVFGVVGSIDVDSSGSLETVLFRSPVNVLHARYVEIDRQGAAVKSDKK